MIYLLSQILLCLALAALLGGAVGWLLHRSRSVARIDELHDAIELRDGQLERARTEVAMLTDDFDDLRERSRVEIDELREDNRRLPALADNLEKSQLLVRQMMQRHDARTRELSAANATLGERLAQLQERAVAQERALVAAAAAARSSIEDGIARVDGDSHRIARSEHDRSRIARSGDDREGRDPADGDSTDGDREVRVPDPASVRTMDADTATAGTAREAGGAPMPDGDSDGRPDECSVEPSEERSGGIAAADSARPESNDGAGSNRRGWASLTLDGADGAEPFDESLDEVVELDDDLAAELLDDTVETDDGLIAATFEDRPGTPVATPAEVPTVTTNETPVDATHEETRPMTHAAAGEGEGEGEDEDEDEDEDEYDAYDEDEANATLAIEVFTMEDLHDDGATSDETDSPATDGIGDPPARLLFRPVDRQDDLKRIFGITPVTERALNELGITSYPQLAELERPEIEKIARALEIVPETIEEDDWVGNARRQLEDVLEEL